MTTQKSDEGLVKEIQAGQILQFEILVKKYQEKLLRFANRYVRSEKDAEEVVQDAFVKCYLNIERIDTSRKFSTYLFEIAKNTAISLLRKNKIEVPLEENVLTDDHETTLESLARQESSEKIRTTVELLPEKYRTIVKMFYFEEMSYEKISSRLKLPLNTVRTHLRRAKYKLKGLLK